MKNKELRKIAKENMKGKMGKAIGITLVYFIITFLLSFVLELIPIVGALASSIISVPLVFGWTKQLIQLSNGENVGIMDFFKHGFGNFGKVWCSDLWIVLKLIPWILGMILGYVLLFTISEVLGVIVIFGTLIGMMVKCCKYCMLNYTLAYDKDGLRARDLVNKSATEAKGNIWKFICMGLYYGLTVALIVLGCSFIMTFITMAAEDFAIIAMIAGYILMMASMLYYQILNIVACNELYKNNVLGNNAVEYTSDENSNVSNDYNFNA